MTTAPIIHDLAPVAIVLALITTFPFFLLAEVVVRLHIVRQQALYSLPHELKALTMPIKKPFQLRKGSAYAT
jgi:hypothetical protein